MTDKKRETDELRQEIARIDAQLLGSLDKRARLSRQIGELRKGETGQVPAPDRVALAALAARGGGEMPPESTRAIFREIMNACSNLEVPSRIVYLGPEGGASHVAARVRFGAGAQLAPIESIPAAIEEVARQRADFAVVPLETRGEGPVYATINALTSSDLKIVSALESTATVHLMNRTGNVADIEKVYATASDHAQCRDFILSHETGSARRVSVLEVKSPLFACQVALDDHGAAALVSEEFGGPLGLHAARKNVLDARADRVRYAVVGARPSSRTGEDVTAFVFSVQDTPGALLAVLGQFAERGINVLKIQSQPAPGPVPGDTRPGASIAPSPTGWSYLFFVEVLGHATDRQLVTAFDEVKRVTRFFKVLGSYPTTS